MGSAVQVTSIKRVYLALSMCLQSYVLSIPAPPDIDSTHLPDLAMHASAMAAAAAAAGYDASPNHRSSPSSI